MISARGWRAALYKHPLLLIAGLFLAGLSLIVVGRLYADQREERSFTAFSERLMQTFVEQQQHELEKLLRDYAVWDDFAEHVHGEVADQVWLEKNLTDSLYKNFSIVDALVISARQQPVYALHRGEPINMGSLAEWNHEFADILERRLKVNPGLNSLSGAVRTAQGVELLVAERIRTERETKMKGGSGWLIFSRHLDPTWLEETARLLSIQDVKVMTSRPESGVPAYTLLGMDKQPVGWISWQIKRINGERVTLIPLVASLFFLFLFVLLLARAVFQMHKWQFQVQKRMLQQSETLRQLSHRSCTGDNDEVYLRDLANSVRNTLGVARVTVWQNNVARGCFQCIAVSDKGVLPDTPLDTHLHADYFRMLSEHRTLVIEDVAQKKYLESMQDYWKRQGVASLLDAAIMVRGRLSGVLSVEASKTPVAWTQDQISFVDSAADLVALEYESIERQRTEAALHRQQYYDVLTGLPNQIRLGQLLQQYLLTPGCRLVYALWSVAGLMHLNEALGRMRGDQLLQEIARRLGQTPGEIIAARLAGNRFVLVLLNVPAPQVSQELERVHYRLLAPVMLGETEVVPQLACGVSLAPQDALTADELLRHAEFALETARSSSDSPLEFYAPEPNAVAREHYQLAGALPAALLRGEFEVLFQPIVDLSRQTILGAEALLRWYHPEKGPISPLQFIPIAEETGQIHALGRYVLESACRQLRLLLEQTGKSLIMAVNVSPLQLRDPQFPDFVSRVLHEQNLLPGALELEITESMSIELFEQAPDSLQRLRDLGIRLAIDDFGTGYSSLSYLRHLPVQKLKIDKSFIEHVPDKRQDADLTRMIISMGHILDMAVVAEGVETEEQRQFLLAQGCLIGQGYLFSRPVNASVFATMLAQEVASVQE